MDEGENRVPSRRIATQTIKAVHRFLLEYEVPFHLVRSEREPVVHALWGWLMWLTEQAMFVARNAHRSSGVALMPIVRSVGEHADAMIWLADTGVDGMAALHISKQSHQQQLYDAYLLAEGHAPPGVDRMPDEHVSESASQLRALDELKSIEQRAASFEGVPYYVFRTLSDQVHAGLGTSRVYAPVDSGGTGQMLTRPAVDGLHGWPDAALADCAIRCAEALLVFSSEVVQDSVLREAALAWCVDLGLDSDLPQRIKGPKRSYDSDAVKRAAIEALPAVEEARALVAKLGTEVPEVDPTLAYRALRNLRSACLRVSKAFHPD